MKTVRVQMLLSPEESDAIDDWRFPRRIDSRSEAIRQLVKKGMEVSQAEAGNEKGDGETLEG